MDLQLAVKPDDAQDFFRIRGFSLLELLVVIAIVGVLWALGSGQLRPTIAGPDVRSAEAEIAGLLNLTRAHALRLNRAARLFVELEPADPEGGQRLFILAQDQGGGEWIPVGPLHRLGPHAMVVSDALLARSPVEGASELASTFHGQADAGWRDEASCSCGYIHFSATGTSFGTPQLVLMPVTRQPPGWVPVDPQRARRLLVRPGGAVVTRSASPPP